ncbi:GIY-YIG nuclease family protein [Haloarcula sp. S1AR25-5A]|uniref:GIY-YIG nuclease family protein n=1 Tax=Haloarcula terrestris TaxID=2950533 RepID=A0AAE4EWR4_9EURY|nr:GIY-YIG nuclease family protein [Haloarcula terrestris]MDS0220201.1 GIY-YIG nuclease family protein [Haloarcula terrestris]
MAGGTYTLVLKRDASGPITVGALGEIEFPAGWYAYTGSALGSGGFSRIDRHRAVAAGDNDTRHWHIDYLLGDTTTTIERVVTTEADVECAVAQRIGGSTAGFDRVDSFGCSDCDCRSHLRYHERRDRLLDAVTAAHEAARDETAAATE